ncbi:MAG: AAA family ATPase [Nanoarchaeota archaeon]|nr:AAA family ATPase [Nanoarchaeota archaeon]
MKKALIITGVPGTGKTTIAKQLAQQLNAVYLDINQLIKPYQLAEGYDKKLKTYLINQEKLINLLINLITVSKKTLIIDSHLSHHLPKQYVKTCIITTCSIPTLKQRLQKRNYNKKKIAENIEAELCNVCLGEALDQKHKLLIIDTTHPTKNINWKKAL